MDAALQFLEAMKQRKKAASSPLISLCYAQSLDGSLSLSRKRATQISGEAARKLTHRLRARHEAILVGVGTLLADDPLLTVRLVEGNNPQVVILDTHLRTPVEARVLRENPAPIWIATSSLAAQSRRRALEAAGARLLTLDSDDQGLLHLDSLLQRLKEIGIHSLMVEGGARVITSFLHHKLADIAIITLAPWFLGGVNLIDNDSLDLRKGSPRVPLASLEELGFAFAGGDLILWGAVQYP